MSAAPAKAGKTKKEEVPAAPLIGRFDFSGGGVYEGQYVKGADGKPRRQGQGLYRCGNVCYEGEWKEDVMSGTGTFTGATGLRYAGAFKDGKYVKGDIRFPDGATYSGDFAANKFSGAGTFTTAQGVVYSGRFENGAFLDGAANVAVAVGCDR